MSVTVVVGSWVSPLGKHTPEQQEVDGLAKAIEDAGFPVERTDYNWVRNAWVYVSHSGRRAGRYVLNRCIDGKDDGDGWADGGNIYIGRGFILAANHLFADSQQAARGEKHYPGMRIRRMPVPPPEYHYNTPEHLDLSCLLVPSAALLIIYKKYYDDRSVGAFSDIAHEEGLSLEFHECPKNLHEFQYPILWPTNCLVVPRRRGDIVFANSTTPEFTEILRKYGVDVVEVPVAHIQDYGGSIRCTTNLKRSETPLSELITEGSPVTPMHAVF